MATLIIITLILILYIVPGYFDWRYIHIAHSKGGIFENVEVSGSDVVLTIFPILNILACITWWDMGHPLKGHSPRVRPWHKFFKIEK